MRVWGASGGGILKAVIGLTLCAAPALGEVCSFTQECFEADGCSETQFEMTIEPGQIVTDAETIPISSGGSQEVRVSVGYTPSAFHVLTRDAGGAARYSTHIFDGPLMINYLGTCE